MVEDAITDPKRIAELFASELTGLATGPLAAVTVVDADPDATPSPDGTVAYALESDGKRVGRVSLYPESAVVDLGDGVAAESSALERDGLAVEETDDGVVLRLSIGAAVKSAVDVVRTSLSG
jgi:hypothetical protein